MPPNISSGSALLTSDAVPTFENSGQTGALRVPSAACWSVQAVLPSAALGLIEKPSGSSTVVARICDDAGTLGLSPCGTLSLTSRPEAVSVWSVVGTAERLGLKASWSHPVVAGQA